MPTPSIMITQLEVTHSALEMDEAGKTHCPTGNKNRFWKQALNAAEEASTEGQGRTSSVLREKMPRTVRTLVNDIH